jgi:hypothetical protein
MGELESIQLCILGHSGVGKSPLPRLFNDDKVIDWEPFRVRRPRNAQDAKVCMNREEFDKYLSYCKENEELIYQGQGENQLRIYETWSFFKVRDTDQCLEHKIAKEANKSLRIEIYAPILVEMLQVVGTEAAKRHFPLDRNKLLIILLNPTSCSFGDMQEPSQELCLATLFAITERSRIQGKDINLADGLRRVEHLKDELDAWKKLLQGFPDKTVECKRWPHFEFRYSTPHVNLSNAQIELIGARATLLKAIKEQACNMSSRVKNIMCTPEVIAKLTEIV